MKPATIPAETDALTLEAVLARLAAHDAVDGILLMGSTGTGNLTPTSDYDLLLVLAELPVPMRMVTTWVDGRLTEVYCTTVRAIERIIVDPAAWADLSEEGTIVNWLRSGRVAYDRTGRLQRAQELARVAPPPALPGERELYAAWLKAGYNVLQTRRKLTSDDPAYLLAVDYRLLVYGLGELWPNYFFARGLPWRGEVQASRYFADHDPDYLDRFWACAAEPDREHRLELYEELVRLTFAPVDEPWAAGTTVISFGPGFADAAPEPPGSVEDALAFWRRLIADDAGTVMTPDPGPEK